MEGHSTQVPVHVTVLMATVELVVKVSNISLCHQDHRQTGHCYFSFPCVSLYSNLYTYTVEPQK